MMTLSRQSPDLLVLRLLRSMRTFLFPSRRGDWMPAGPVPSLSLPEILVVVEGHNGIEFLRRISRMLHIDAPGLPDLAEMEGRRELIFVPAGGGDATSWIDRLAGLGLAEFHLLDRDVPPVTKAHRQAAAIVNCRPRCCARITSKRSLENYLDPESIREVSGIVLDFSDDEDVPDLVAQHIWSRQSRRIGWRDLPARARKRHRDRVKRWLNTLVVDRMTIKRLAQTDPGGEVRSWLETIARLAPF